MTLDALLLLWLCGAAFGQSAAPEGMVLVPAGEFRLGSAEGNPDEAPERSVRLSAFAIDKTEVTNAAFAAFARSGDNASRIEGPWWRYSAEGALDLLARRQDPPRRRAAQAALRAMAGTNSAALPVRGVSWRDATAFCRWSGKRLPTEAEWEKAARGTDGRRYPWGGDWKPGNARAGLEPEAGPAPVGSFPASASPYGCLDMAGNVWEWVADWYAEDAYSTLAPGAPDPRGPAGLENGQLPGLPSPEADLLRQPAQGRERDTRKVLRGGGFSGTLESQARYNSRTTRRLWSNPSYWHPDAGFRCAKDTP